MRRLLIPLLIIMIAVPSVMRAQAAEDSVRAAVTALFDAMRQGDSAAIATCFTDSARLEGVDPRGVSSVSPHNFGHIIASLPRGSCDERPRFDLVRIDRTMAMVWAPYEFYYNGQFHHCGTDSFQLVQENGVWKIRYAISTEWRAGCPSH